MGDMEVKDMAKMKTGGALYRVLNPQGIPAGVPIVSYGKGGVVTHWYEGDVFEAPVGFDSDGRLLREGYLAIEASAGSAAAEVSDG